MECPSFEDTCNHCWRNRHSRMRRSGKDREEEDDYHIGLRSLRMMEEEDHDDHDNHHDDHLVDHSLKMNSRICYHCHDNHEDHYHDDDDHHVDDNLLHDDDHFPVNLDDNLDHLPVDHHIVMMNHDNLMMMMK